MLKTLKMLVILMVLMVTGSVVAEESAEIPKDLPPHVALVHHDAGVFGLIEAKDPAPKVKFGKPEAGNKHIAIKFGFVALGDKEVPVNPMFFQIKCADNAVRKASFADAPDPKLSSSSVSGKGDEVVGWVMFEIPTGLEAAGCKVSYGVMEKSKWIKVSDIPPTPAK